MQKSCQIAHGGEEMVSGAHGQGSPLDTGHATIVSDGHANLKQPLVQLNQYQRARQEIKARLVWLTHNPASEIDVGLIGQAMSLQFEGKRWIDDHQEDGWDEATANAVITVLLSK